VVRRQFVAGLIRALVQAGAEVNARNNAGITPLMFAAAKNPKPEVTCLFLSFVRSGNHQATTSWTLKETFVT
jgi:ankyrin repeat protein